LRRGCAAKVFETCGCSRQPEFRPRTSAQVRARRRLADRTGVAVPVMLAARDPYDAGQLGDTESPGGGRAAR
jgi:hypothetical protein